MKLASLFSSLRALRIFSAAILFSVASSAAAQITLTLTPTDTTKVYGDAEPETWYTVSGNRRTAQGFGFTLTGNFADGDDEEAVLRTADRHRILVREAGDDVGSYAFSLASDFTGWTALGGSTPVPNIQRGVIKGKFFRDAFATTPKYRVVLAQNAEFTINKKEVTYTSTAADKVYDGTTAAPASLGGSFAADDLEDGDTVTASGGTYASDQVGEGIAITGFSPGGDDGDNYSLASGSSVAGDITAKSLTLSGVKLTKEEGGGTATTGATVAATINGLVSGHTGSLALVGSPTAVFASAAAGDGITITGLTAAQLVLTVVDSGNNPVAASNYQLPGGNIAATGQITSVAITPPDAPGAPTLTPNFQSIEVSWTAPANNGNAITDNLVRWRTSATDGPDGSPGGGDDVAVGDWNGVGNNGILTGNTATSYTITGLTNGTQYDVQVAAVNGGGAGAFSRTASAAPVANNANLASLVLTDPDGGAVTLSPAFAVGTTEYAATVDAADASVTVTATATDAADATISMTRETGGVTGSAQTLTGGTASSPQALVHLGPDAGDQQTVILEITVTAGDGTTRKSYEVIVRRPNGPPGAPATPTAATGTAAGSLDIGWSAPSATGGLAITGYRVRWGKDAPSVAWNASGDGILAGNQSVTSYTITGLETGTAYQVQVAAVNSEGTGAWSDSVTITPQAASVDADITALAVNEADGTTPVMFSPAFSAATTAYAATVDNDVTGVIFIATYAGSKLVIDGDADNDPDSGSASEVIALTVGVAKDITLVVTAADDSTTKTYTVTVTRAAGAPVKPAKPTSARSTAASRSIAVSWAWAGGAANNGSPVTEFNVQWKKTGDTNWLPDANGQVISDASDRSYAVTGLDAGARYHARVRAVNAAGDGAWSDNSDAARASGPPSAPIGVLLSQIVGGITVNVQSFGGPDNGGSDIVAHHVRWRTAAQGGNPAGEWQNSAGDSEDGQRFTASAFGGSHNINGLIGGTRYEVQARWQNGFSDNNLGPWSRSFFQSPSRMSLSLTPKAATKVYGEADPALDYDAVRFVNLDTKANVFASVPFERVAGETVGEYNYRLKDPIPWATAGNPAGRYTLSTTLGGSAKFTITAKEITYTSTAADKTYDGNVNAPSDLGGSFSAGVVNTSVNGVTIDDTATGKLSVTGGQFQNKTAGDNKAVTQFVLDGDSKDNYTLASGSSVTGDIAKLATTLTLNVNSRVYDGTTDTGAVTAVFSPEIISGDTVTVDVSGAVYADANAGTGKTINGVADAQITGADKANYEITIESAGEVTKRPLRVAASGSGNARPQTAALGDRSLLTIASGVSGEGLVSPDTAATVLSGSIALGGETGSAPRFTSPLTIGTLAASGNYELIFTAGEFIRSALQTLVVKPVETTRVFGGADPAAFTWTVEPQSGSAYITGDDANTNFFNSGQAVVQRAAGTDAGRYAFSLVNPLPTAAGIDAKYLFVIEPGAEYTITPKALTAAAITLTKEYDGATTIAGATIGGGLLSGLESSDAATLALKSDAVGAYDSADAGTGISMTGVDSDDFELAVTSGTASNYAVPSSLSVTGVITAKEVSVASVTLTKEYDGDTTLGSSVVKVGTGEVTGEAGSETLVVTPTAGAYDAAGAGTRTVTGAEFQLASPDSSADEGNYTLPSGITVDGEITPKEVTVADVTVTKTFDDTTAMTGVVVTGGAVTGAVGTQTFTLRLAAANDGVYDSANAGSNINVTGADFELVAFVGGSGSPPALSDPANYALPSITIIGVIEAKGLTISGVATLRKSYDGTPAAAATGANAVEVVGGVIAGAVGSNTFRLALASGHDITYPQSDAGGPLTFTNADAADFELQSAGDGNPANYELPDEISALGEIAPREVSVAEVTLTKPYDGTAVVGASVVVSGGELGNLVDGEALALEHVSGIGSFPQSDVGTGLQMSGVQFRLQDGAGGQAANYQLPTAGVDVVGVITAKEVAVADPELVKEFDNTRLFGNTKLAAGTGAVTGTVGGDALVLAPTAAEYGTESVATGIRVTDIAWELQTAPDGAGDPGNYSLPASLPALLETGGEITPKTLALTQGNTVPTREYNGTVDPPPGLTAMITATGLVSGADDVGFAGSNYNSKDVLTARYLIVALSGQDAANYRLDEDTPGVPATITPKPITVNAAFGVSTVTEKVYDGTTAAPAAIFNPIGGSDITIAAGQLVPADEGKVAVGVGGVYASKDVGGAAILFARCLSPVPTGMKPPTTSPPLRRPEPSPRVRCASPRTTRPGWPQTACRLPR